LNDEVLIETLEQSKIESQEIEERIRKQEQDRELFNIIRGTYREAAKRVSNLYFVVLDLASLEPTYCWSLEFYIHLYERSIKDSSHSKEHRSKNIIEKF
jgi:dynein heavy chain